VRTVRVLPSKEKRWALIIGIDDYEKDVSTLKGAVNDAVALKNVLVKYAGFPESQIIMLTSNATDPDDRPKRENILGALSDLGNKMPQDGLLLFSFSGHGVSVGNQAFLVPSNGRITKNLSLLKSLSINVLDLNEAIREIKVKQVLMLLDACRNELGRGDSPNLMTEPLKAGFSFDVANSEVKAFATLFATSVGERAFEFYDKATGQFRGYFSYAVEEAFRGAAANEKGEVTLSRLISHLETTVPVRVRMEMGEEQRPSTNVSDTYRANELLLAVSGRQVEPSFSAGSEVISGEAAFWHAIENSPEIADFKSYLVRCLKGEFAGVYKPAAELKLSRLTKPLAAATWTKIRPTARLLMSYDLAYLISSNLILISSGGWNATRWGLIDRSGRRILQPKYHYAGLFTEDTLGQPELVSAFAEGLLPVELNGNWGFIDKTGKEVVPLKYGYCFEPFSEGLVPVDVRGKYGFVDREGRLVIAPKYDRAGRFSEGLAMVGEKGRFGYIDRTGREVIPLQYEDASAFSGGRAAVASKGLYGFIDKTGKVVIPFNFNGAYEFSEGLAPAELKGKHGFVDLTGLAVFPFRFDSVSRLSEGLATVAQGGKMGVIDATGAEVVPIRYDEVRDFYRGLAQVWLNRKFGYVDRNGLEVVRAKYDSVWCEVFLNEGFVGVELNGKKGFADIYGNEYFDF
jgi:hypothetical protein